MIKAGETFTKGGVEWVVLDTDYQGGVFALTKDFLFRAPFDEENYNNWRVSTLRNRLEEWGKKFEEKNGNILMEFKRDIISDDGLDDYGVCHDKVSLLTQDEYKKYRQFIGKKDDWWWLLTPQSTHSSYARVINTDGSLNYYGAYVGGIGVSAACVFSPSAFDEKSPETAGDPDEYRSCDNCKHEQESENGPNCEDCTQSGGIYERWERKDEGLMNPDVVRGINIAWEIARKITALPSGGGYTADELREMGFNGTFRDVFARYFGLEVIEKVRAYDDRIRVGDEVRINDGSTGVITIVHKNNGDAVAYNALRPDGSFCQIWDLCAVEKTGNHYTEVAKLLARMQEEENNADSD